MVQLKYDQMRLVLLAAVLLALCGVWGMTWALLRKGGSLGGAVAVFWVSLAALVLGLVAVLGVEASQ